MFYLKLPAAGMRRSRKIPATDSARHRAGFCLMPFRLTNLSSFSVRLQYPLSPWRVHCRAIPLAFYQHKQRIQFWNPAKALHLAQVIPSTPAAEALPSRVRIWHRLRAGDGWLRAGCGFCRKI
jgi:hypothetical protein